MTPGSSRIVVLRQEFKQMLEAEYDVSMARNQSMLQPTLAHR
jgi:hypothetical protein